MKAECIKAVTQAIGRAITTSESRDLETRIRDAMRRIAAKDPNKWGTMSKDQRLAEAAQDAADQLIYEAQLKKVRIAQTIIAHDRVQNYLNDQVAKGADKTKLDALERIMAPKNDGKNNTLSIESQSRGIVAYGMGKLFDAWEAVHPRFFGIFRNKQAEEALLLELHGRSTGDPKLAKAAKSFHDLAEEMRQRFNAAGGSIGRLEDWGMPHKWSDRLFIKEGTDTVVRDFMNWVDRSKYYHEDGRAFDDAEMASFLKEAWMTISTNGANKQIRVDVPGGSIKANRHGAHRSIHFRDGQSALEAVRKYSDQNLFQTLSGHVRSMARDIAVVETLGPNADLQLKYQVDNAYREAAVADPAHEGRYAHKAEGVTNLYNYVAGNNPPPSNLLMAHISQDVRNVLSAALLGSSPITSIADIGTVYLTAHVNNLPLHKVFLNQVKAFNPANRGEERLAMRAGLMVDTMISEMNRFASENSGPRLSSRISNTAIRLSGLPAMTEANRRAFSVTMMDTIGHLTRNFKSLKDLDVNDHKLLLSKGITEEDWAIWSKSTPETWRGNDTVLTADAIMRTSDQDVGQAIDKSIGALHEKAISNINKLLERNSEEIKWADKRNERLQNYREKLDSILGSFSELKGKNLVQIKEYANSRIELLKAQNEQIAIEADLNLYIKEQNRKGVPLEDIFQDTRGEAVRPGRGVGMSLGKRMGNSERRITEIKEKIRVEESKFSRDVKEKAVELSRRLGKASEDTSNRHARMQERIAKRDEIVNSIQKRLPDQVKSRISIARQQAATKLLGLVLEEQDIAVIQPGARERADMAAGTRSGTMKGELIRSFFLFKSFPWSMMMRHWERGLKMYDGAAGKAGYISSLIALQTVLGALALEVNDVVSGRNPRNLSPTGDNWKRNWVSAFLKGGAFGLYGDFLFNESTAGYRSLIGTVAGPVAGLVEATDDLTRGNIIQMMEGQDTRAGGEAIRFLKGITPGANLWYTKAAFNHLIFNELQEYFSPGYLAHQKARSQRVYGTSYWWAPGENFSDARFPDLSTIASEN